MNTVERITVKHLNHASFLITCGQVSILIDPFFLGTFFWEGHQEVQVDNPDIKLEHIPTIDVILCSHIHGDHFEIETVSSLIQRDDSILIAPENVILTCIKAGLKKRKLMTASIKEPFPAGHTIIICLPNKGYENEVKCSKLSFLIGYGDKKIFHSGDSHGYSESWKEYRGKIDLACLWCVKTEEMIENLQPHKVFLHHFQKFSPGQFSCNVDIGRLMESLQKKFNKVIFLNPVECDTVIV
ncbi:MAG TPA: MBL fold metallo-hydrolase [bacterium]|nr:MBL fold metallo-hydrolase [bacterium]HPP07982.1 MBL fold metallo-hydrolase [bacterium]